MNATTLQAGQWLPPGTPTMDPGFTRDDGGAAERFSGLQVVAPAADAARVATLLGAGARRVLVGESALRDGQLMAALNGQFGPDRVGLWLPVRRASVAWGLDRESNADFNFIAIGCPVPRWLVLRADRSLTDVDAVWWAQEMVAAGAALVLVAVEDPEDDDLSVCAELAEAIGERLWLSPGSADPEELRFWTQYGQARNLVLPEGADAPALLAALGGYPGGQDAAA